MFAVLSITIPFFAIIFLGTFFRAKNIFDDNASNTLTKFTFFDRGYGTLKMKETKYCPNMQKYINLTIFGQGV